MALTVAPGAALFAVSATALGVSGVVTATNATPLVIESDVARESWQRTEQQKRDTLAAHGVTLPVRPRREAPEPQGS